MKQKKVELQKELKFIQYNSEERTEEKKNLEKHLRAFDIDPNNIYLSR